MNEGEGEGETGTKSIPCSHCGARLAVPPDTQFLTCIHCGTLLEFQPDGGVHSAHVPGDIDSPARRIERAFAKVETRDRLEQLDRDWIRQRDRYKVHGRYGNQYIPSKTGAIVGAAIVVAVGMAMIGMAISQAAPVSIALIGVLMVAGGVIGGRFSANQSNRFQDAEANYEYQRRLLLDEMERKRDESGQ